MAVVVRIPTPLRRLSNGQEKVEVPEGSLKSIIDSLEHGGLSNRVDLTAATRYYVRFS